ncbi:MAG: DNA-binding response regulator [Verrucomicrobiales bacterium]|nr:DNA-binding response regulator [Verrucomicrobiales bacterium]
MNEQNLIKVVIVEDHPIFRAGLRQVISEDASILVLGEAINGADGLKMARQLNPDVLLLDIDLPEMNGLDVASEINDSQLKMGIIILTMYREENMFNAAMDRGVKGYVLKENAPGDLVACIKSVANGQYYLTASISGYLVRRNARAAELRKKVPTVSDLSPTERRILKMIGENKGSKEIAEVLFISPRTVGTHRTNISIKLGLSGSHSLIQFAIEHRSEL